MAPKRKSSSMKMAHFKDLKKADDAARAVISLTKAILREQLSQNIARLVPCNVMIVK